MAKRIAGLMLLLLLATIGTEAKEKGKTHERMPVLAWYSIPPNETTFERYQEMREMGITHSLTFFPSLESLKKALDVAQQAGIKLIVNCHELRTDPEKVAGALKNHPAIAGYHLMDEPGISLYPELGDWARRIRSVDSTHFCYVNLFPNFADSVTQLGTSDYRRYVSECARQIPLDFLSFDFYPVMKDRLSKSWYQNLEQFAGESKKAGKPFWAFALTTNYDNDHLTPQTLAAMRLQVYSDLAYGAQGIEFFTYWSATSTENPSSEDQRGAPITAAGKRSVVYDRARQMGEEIRNLSDFFVGAKMVWVRHAGKGMIPTGTVRLSKLPEKVKVLDSGGAPILVSLLEKGDNEILMVVNKDFLNSINLTFYGDESVRKILKDGSTVPASAYESTLELEPGDAALYLMPKVLPSK
ncbi:MAG: beta-galactosidase [Marinilabiliales bacterium]|nr:beta-galactosidase [Marinilabiliales bacterium]